MSPDIIDFADWTPARIVSDLESLIRREGARQYGASDSRLGFYRAQLCGVSAHLMPKTGICRLYTADTDIIVGADGALSFVKGNVASLRLWHRHLNAYRRAMRTGSAIAA